jgi:peptidoglycan/xylan/chitin deacetylase (PgdA/CDA1 family)
MYHTVGVVEPRWCWHFLTVPWQTFESQVAFLKTQGYETVFLNDLYDHYAGLRALPERSVLFTFDDGYLDNWVYVFPILKKYGMRGTIFVNPEFVDPTPSCRPTLIDYWAGRISESELPKLGFLSWAEMRAMELEGVMDIQSHGMTHTWYPSGPQIVDFRHPGDEYVWMDWNAAPDQKWDYLRDGGKTQCNFGEPVYEHQKSLAARRFLTDSTLAAHLVKYTSTAGSDFFERSDWRDILFGEAERYRTLHSLVERYETDEEYSHRLDWELRESQQLIGDNLGKKVPFLCWPGGGYGADALTISKRYYKSSTISSRDNSAAGINADTYLRIRRIGVPSIEIQGKIIYPGGSYLYHYMKESQGNRFHRLIRQLHKLTKLILSGLNKNG